MAQDFNDDSPRPMFLLRQGPVRGKACAQGDASEYRK